MKFCKYIKLKPLIASIAISLSVGLLSSIVTIGNHNIYSNILKPPFSPSFTFFLNIWFALYILMGISAYIIFESSSIYKKQALTVYGLQLVVNFFLPIIFFNLKAFWVAFIWQILLLALVIALVFVFYKISKVASILQIPCMLWLIFCSLLSLCIAFIN